MFAHNSSVYTTTGSMSISNLTGDFVLSMRESVYASARYSGIASLKTMTLADRRSVQCDDTEQFYVYRNSEWRWMNIADIRESDCVAAVRNLEGGELSPIKVVSIADSGQQQCWELHSANDTAFVNGMLVRSVNM